MLINDCLSFSKHNKIFLNFSFCTSFYMFLGISTHTALLLKNLCLHLSVILVCVCVCFQWISVVFCFCDMSFFSYCPWNLSESLSEILQRDQLSSHGLLNHVIDLSMPCSIALEVEKSYLY